MLEKASLTEAFREHFGGGDAPHVCRAPGRVNLIGEHLDYNGLPVLPMALDRYIEAAFRPRTDSKILLANMDEAYAPMEFENGPSLTPSPAGTWDNYAKAAVNKLNEHLGVKEFPGFEMLVDADLPAAAGLSSSSAMVVASALAYLDVLGQPLEDGMGRIALSDLMAEAEHFVGTRGGGMDQTVILNNPAGGCCKIDFFPLRVEEAPVFEDASFVVCNSMVKVEKSGAALARFNAGPRLCALACALVEAHVRKTIDPELELARMGDLWFGPLCMTHAEVEALFGEVFATAAISQAEAASRLGKSEDFLIENYLRDIPPMPDGLALRGRANHARTEYRRVEAARDAFVEHDVETFGRLMNESYASCRDDFLISSPELEALVGAALDSGALGSRLTGAGFGGATVSLVMNDQVDDFIAGVGERYYRKFLKYLETPPIFVAHSGAAANYL